MIELSIDRENHIVVVRFVTSIEPGDFAAIDRALKALPDAASLRCIVDLDGVTDIRIAGPEFVSRAKRQPALPTVYKVFVAPTELSFGLSRQFATHRDLAGHPGPRVVRSFDEALQRLAADDARFEPLPVPPDR